MAGITVSRDRLRQKENKQTSQLVVQYVLHHMQYIYCLYGKKGTYLMTQNSDNHRGSKPLDVLQHEFTAKTC